PSSSGGLENEGDAWPRLGCFSRLRLLAQQQQLDRRRRARRRRPERWLRRLRRRLGWLRRWLRRRRGGGRAGWLRRRGGVGRLLRCGGGRTPRRVRRLSWLPRRGEE